MSPQTGGEHSSNQDFRYSKRMQVSPTHKFGPNSAPARWIMWLALLQGIFLCLPARSANAPAESPVNIEAREFEMLLAERRAVYRGGVVAVQGQYRIQADRLVVYFAEDNRILSLLATGTPARVTDEGQEPPLVMTANNLDYQFEQARIRATGNGALSRSEDRLAAEVITYDLNTATAHAESQGERRVLISLIPDER